MTEALIGFLGVIVGAAITVLYEFIQTRIKKREQAEYLAIRIVCMLDKFVEKCADVVNDDGKIDGVPAGEGGCCTPQVISPKFDPMMIGSAEWKVLHTKLLYETLTLPNLVQSADALIQSDYDHVGPMSTGFYNQRQYQYALLGLKAFEIASGLRKEYNLPKQELVEWNPIDELKRKKQEIEDYREKQVTTN